MLQPKQSKPKEGKKPKARMAPMEPMEPMKPKAPKMSPSKKRRILEAEGRMQQGQTGSVGPPIDVSGAVTKTPPTKEEADAIKRTLREGRGQEFKKGRSVKKGYAMGGKMKKGYAKGGKVRGAGIARKGVRPAKMR